jgi:hypothetical protein
MMNVKSQDEFLKLSVILVAKEFEFPFIVVKDVHRKKSVATSE